GSPVTSRTRPTARPAPTAPVPRLSVPLILLDTSGLLDPVPVISTAMRNTLGCDSNHVSSFHDTFDDPSRGQILGFDSSSRWPVVHDDTLRPHFHPARRGQQGDLLPALDQRIGHHRVCCNGRSRAQRTLQRTSCELASFRQIIITRATDSARLYFYVLGA